METQEYENIFKSEDAHWWYAGMRSIFFALASRHLREGLKILDAGCGSGKNAEVLGEFGRVFAIDISGEAMKFSKKRRIRNLMRASNNNLPFKNNSFDFVTSFDVLYHRDVEDLNATKEIARVCKPNGLAFVRVPALESLMRAHDKIVHTKRRYARKELKSLLDGANFKTIRMTYANFFLLPLVYFAKGGGSDIKETGTLLNAVLKSVLKLEAFLLKYINFPLGVSLIAVAQKTY